MIVTGDDFGLSVPVNEAIEHANHKGILTTASLMVGAPAFDDAVARARKSPNLKVGLHLVLSHGQSCLPHTEIPDLVTINNFFSNHEVRSGIKLYFNSELQKQLAAEIREQFSRFQQTGLQLDHVNAHRNMHLHPTVFDLILGIGKDFGLTAVRLPAEPVVPELAENSFQFRQRQLVRLSLSPLLSRMKHRLDADGLNYNEHVFGFYNSGHMNQDQLVRTLAHLPDGISEIYTHPATGAFDNIETGAEDYEFEAEYKALIHPRIQRALDKFDIQLRGFNA